MCFAVPSDWSGITQGRPAVPSVLATPVDARQRLSGSRTNTNYKNA
jgi:hypothetical protein